MKTNNIHLSVHCVQGSAKALLAVVLCLCAGAAFAKQSPEDDALNNKLEGDYKSLLQEKIQAKDKHAHIHYEVVSETGPDHDKHFVMKLMISDKEISKGSGKKKKEAEQNAAKKALEEGDI